MDGCAGELFHDIAACLSACVAHQCFMKALVVKGHLVESNAHFKMLFGRAQDVWNSLESRLAFKVILQVQVTLVAFAWVECEGAVLAGNPPAQPGSAATTR